MSYKDFFADINQQTLKNIYIFHGHEVLLIDRMLEAAKEKCLSPLAQDFNYLVVNAETIDYEKAYSLAEMLPVMDSRRIVVLKQPQFLLKEAWSDDLLQSYIKLHSGSDCTTTTILWVDSLDKRKKIVKEISKIGAVVAFDALEEADLNKWIRSELKRLGKTMSLAVAGHFIERSGYYHQDTPVDLYRMLNWIQTLAPMVQGLEITALEVDAILESTVEANVFKFVDAIFDRQPKLAYAQLKALLAGGEAEIKLLFMIQRHVRQLLKVKMLLTEGFTQAGIADQLALKPFVVKKSANQCSRLSIAGLRQMLFDLEKADLHMKRSSVETQVILEHMIGKLISA